eukprot:TRINITY_DN10391_c0_g1_i2.p1 TRINITY_DN10391_c0_g1~~TRINITY_DN10391_c0_g1_i2.p1  ORF type:complete len:375 (+),score=63.33 TRINITY_DN10391_c0_g1_i2:106-1125(+)
MHGAESYVLVRKTEDLIADVCAQVGASILGMVAWGLILVVLVWSMTSRKDRSVSAAIKVNTPVAILSKMSTVFRKCWPFADTTVESLGERRFAASDAADIADAPLAPLAGVRHVAVIMDGNRRYGKMKHGDGLRGHWFGGEAPVAFVKAYEAEGVNALTVYAFSTENWKRSEREVAELMSVLMQYADEVRVEAMKRDMRVHIWATSPELLPGNVRAKLEKLESDTAHGRGLLMNICISYGSRQELANAARALAQEAVSGERTVESIDETALAEKLTTAGSPEPDILIRTSSERRLSNFLLYQLAYTEFFFVDKFWPEITRADLRDVLTQYMERHRRFGK